MRDAVLEQEALSSRGINYSDYSINEDSLWSLCDEWCSCCHLICYLSTAPICVFVFIVMPSFYTKDVMLYVIYTFFIETVWNWILRFVKPITFISSRNNIIVFIIGKCESWRIEWWIVYFGMDGVSYKERNRWHLCQIDFHSYFTHCRNQSSLWLLCI